MQAMMKIVLTSTVVALLAFLSGSGNAVAQQYGTLEQQMAGTWTLVSVYFTKEDGSQVAPFGPHPKGTVIFTNNARFALQIVRSDLPKFASNDRLRGTPEGYKATVQGSIAYFGTYWATEDGTILHLDGSTFANWTETDQLRIITPRRDTLEFVDPEPPVGGVKSAQLTWKRVR